MEAVRNVFQPMKSKLLTQFVLHKRYGSSWKKRVLKREDRKEEIFHYVGENAKRVDRVYVWGCASTGALGVSVLLWLLLLYSRDLFAFKSSDLPN